MVHYTMLLTAAVYNMITEHEIRTEKCSDTCQHNLTSTKNDLTSVETYTIALNFGLDTCQIKVGIVQVNTKNGQKMSDV